MNNLEKESGLLELEIGADSGIPRPWCAMF
jgi:hypothetical protein